jgi:uncharacterized protein (TIGR02271 family)
MTTQERTTVVGVFESPHHAREAIERLKDEAFSASDISILTPDREEGRVVAEDTGSSHAGGGAATGAVLGGVLGGVGGWLVGIGALAIPGVGPFIAAGAFATALGGAALGAGVGAIAGALMGMGVPEEEAHYYEGEVRQGRTLVTVRAPRRYAEAQGILRDAGAYDIEQRGMQDRTTGSLERTERTERTDDERTMQLREEELNVRKDQVETGQVHLGKELVTEQRTIEVPVTREEVYVERTPVSRQPSDTPVASDREQVVSVPLREEQVEVTKRPVVYEEVSVGKHQVGDTEQVSETVRREEARVEHDLKRDD